MANFNVDNPQANNILVWSDVDQAFINVTPDAGTLNITMPSMSVTKLSNNGHSVVSNFVGDTLQTNTLTAGSGVTLNKSSGEIEISVDSLDAVTLNGFTDGEFLKVSNNLSEIDTESLMTRLDTYTKDKLHDEFMETNASNIPDADNVYDLGSNGRRYADIFAKTFHGTATRALIADSLANKGAKEGDILVWRTAQNDWIPEDILNQYLKKEGLQILPQYGERIHTPTTPTFDVHESNVFLYECDDLESGTIELIAPQDGNAYSATLEIKNGENAGVVWPSYLTWVGQSMEPSFTRHDVFTTYTFDGVNWFGLYVGAVE